MPKGFAKIIDKDMGFKSLVREITKAKEPHVNVGVLSDAGQYAAYSDITKVKLDPSEVKKGGPKHRYEQGRTHSSSTNLADVATWMEFGTRYIRARPFMKQAFDSNYDRIFSFITMQHRNFLDGKQTMEMGLKKIGVFFEGIVKKHMVDGNFAPLKKETIRRKGSSKPLIDTGRLGDSISNQVVMAQRAEGSEK